MVTADFPNLIPLQRIKIYKCLGKKKWRKITAVGRDISTVWYAQFEDDTPYSAAIYTTRKDFRECSKLYTIPKLAIHVGPNKPVF